MACKTQPITFVITYFYSFEFTTPNHQNKKNEIKISINKENIYFEIKKEDNKKRRFSMSIKEIVHKANDC